jgi:phosphatidylglycerol:prolipoprotein diacylglycerol transferase
MIPYPNIDPVFFRIGPLALRWYGLAYATSFLLGLFITRRMALWKKVILTQEQISDLVFHVALGVVLGGRLGYVLFYNLPFYLQHPLQVLAVWEGGMAFHGGLIGVLVAGFLFCKRQGLRFYEIADIAMVSAPVGLGLGRLANFINAELPGRPTDVSWCMVFPGAGAACRHPSQLYQAALEGPLLFGILLILSQKRLPPGVVFWAFFLFYGLFRLMVEFFRQPDEHIGLILGPLSMGQLLSLPMLIVGAVMVWKRITC